MLKTEISLQILTVNWLLLITQGDAMLYNLNAVLVHSGYTANSGHYYCYVKSSSGVWYCMNDANVSHCYAP